jgi:hypothetical protein
MSYYCQDKEDIMSVRAYKIITIEKAQSDTFNVGESFAQVQPYLNGSFEGCGLLELNVFDMIEDIKTGKVTDPDDVELFTKIINEADGAEFIQYYCC